MANFDPSTFGRGLMGLGQQYGSMISQDADRRIEMMKQQVLAQIKQGDKSLDRMVQAHSLDTADKRLALAEKADVRSEADLKLRQDKAAEDAKGEWTYKTISQGYDSKPDDMGVMQTATKLPDKLIRYNKKTGDTEELQGSSWVPIGMSATEAENLPSAKQKRGEDSQSTILNDKTGAADDAVDTSGLEKTEFANKKEAEKYFRNVLMPGDHFDWKSEFEEWVQGVALKDDPIGPEDFVTDSVIPLSSRYTDVLEKTQSYHQNRSDVMSKRAADARLAEAQYGDSATDDETSADDTVKVEENVAVILDAKKDSRKPTTSKTATRPLPNVGTLEEYKEAEVIEIDGEDVKIPKHSGSGSALAEQRLLMKELGLSRKEALKQWANHYWATTQPVEGVPIGPEDFVPAPPKSVVQSEERTPTTPVSAPKLSEEWTPSVVESASTVKPEVSQDASTVTAEGVDLAPVGQLNVGEKTEQAVYSMTSDEATKYVSDILSAVEGKVGKEDIRVYLMDMLGNIPPEHGNTPYAHALARAYAEFTAVEQAPVVEETQVATRPDPSALATTTSDQVSANQFPQTSPIADAHAIASVPSDQNEGIISGPITMTPTHTGQADDQRAAAEARLRFAQGNQMSAMDDMRSISTSSGRKPPIPTAPAAEEAPANVPLTQMSYEQASTAWGTMIKTLQNNKDGQGNRTHTDRIIANELLRLLSEIPQEDGNAPYVKALADAYTNFTKTLSSDTSVTLPSN